MRKRMTRQQEKAMFAEMGRHRVRSHSRRKKKRYLIQVKSKGKWKKFAEENNPTRAEDAFRGAKYSWNNVRVIEDGMVIRSYEYKKAKF